MITKGKKGLFWVFSEHLECMVNAVVIFTSRKCIVRQVLSHFPVALVT